LQECVLADERARDTVDPVADATARLVDRRDGVRVVRVDDLASELGLSARQLHRRCLHAFGYGPKTLARVVRFQHFLHAARAAPTLSFARLAAECGYSDESHLSHDCRALGGVPPGELVRRDT
jgi:AraC-like DNA-binding protein